MKDFVFNIKQQIESEIKNIQNSETHSASQIKQIISFIEERINELKEFIRNYSFRNEQEEILFFKELKPSVCCLLLYYIRVYHIEKRRLGKTDFAQSVSLSKELKQVEKNNEQIGNFYQYYKSGNTDSDYLYFCRDSYNILLDTSCNSFEKERFFSTNHDYDVANIMANDLLKNYLIKETNKLNGQLYYQAIDIMCNHKMQWTDSKTSLVELIYALYSSGCINNGNISLKEMAQFTEAIFQIEIGDLYRTFLEIRGRKKSRTAFLDEIKNKLIETMDKLDNF
nr:RteC domain-containing protein [uncultured Bacteroides sp.]